MCDLCDEEHEGKDKGPVGCPDCGLLICFDCKSGDDFLRPAHVTASGDLYCDRCGLRHDREETEEEDSYVDGFDEDDGEEVKP